jgi:hypothetical protein
MPHPEAAPLRRTEGAGDDALLDRLRQGDADAFEAMVRRETPPARHRAPAPA